MSIVLFWNRRSIRLEGLAESGKVMSPKSEGSNESKNERRVLRGYRQEGKRFIPPFLQLMSLSETKWMDDRVPELVWIALLIHVFGVREGTAVAVSIAKAAAKCDQTAKRAFAATSDYAELSDGHKQCVRSALSAEGTLGKASRGLAALIHHYTEFPLGFLADADGSNEDSSCSTLDDLREAIDSISDRQGHAGIYAQATVVYIFLINDRLTVAPHVGLANLPAIQEYPMTDESQRVAASVRSAVTGLLSLDIPAVWRNSFWNQGRSLGPCEEA